MDRLSKQKIIDYIEGCHLPDGGYFFAGVEPSSGRDTYLAVKTTRLLGVRAKNTKSIADFWQRKIAEGNLDDLFAVFLAVETYKELGLSVAPFKKYVPLLIDQQERAFVRDSLFHLRGDKKMSFAYAMNYIDAHGKDLEDILYLSTLSRDLLCPVDKKRIADVVYASQNMDGGFGHAHESNLMATYYALRILNTLSLPIKNRNKIFQFLVGRLNKSDYLEDVFYATMSLAALNKPVPDVGKIFQYVKNCQRNNGGFGRAQSMGIPTVEYTFMAVSILKVCEKHAGEKYSV